MKRASRKAEREEVISQEEEETMAYIEEELRRIRVNEEEEVRKREEAANSLLLFSEQEYIKDIGTQTSVDMADFSQQTDSDVVDTIKSLQEENQKQQSRILSVSLIEGDDNLVKFYTGLPHWSVSLHLFMFLSPHIMKSTCMEVFDDEFLLTLVRVRLNLQLKDIAICFGISIGMASKIFQKWVDVMYIRLKFLIVWPERELLDANMPCAFRDLYPSCRVIIDCSEIFIETPTSYDARSKTCSHYKKHNTIKFLIGITPCGTIRVLGRSCI